MQNNSLTRIQCFGPFWRVGRGKEWSKGYDSAKMRRELIARSLDRSAVFLVARTRLYKSLFRSVVHSVRHAF